LQGQSLDTHASGVPLDQLVGPYSSTPEACTQVLTHVGGDTRAPSRSSRL